MWAVSYWFSALGACSSPLRASLMPSRPNSSAMPLPMPVPPPVMSATFPATSDMVPKLPHRSVR